jgi:meso-butanediol dehydrogenase/(S,S)-butanediol dehydrogenase/diacetyl reductase
MTAVAQRFTGKTALITAAASGIGHATTRRFLAEGANVLASDIDFEALTASFSDLGDAEGRLSLGQLDVGNYDAVRVYVSNAAGIYSTLDVVVNNAGVGSWGAVETLEVDRWHLVVSVTLDSVFYICKETVPLLRKAGGGAIVNTASMSGLFGDNGFAAYNAAKAGVINLTRTLAIDHATDGIRANAVCPGVTDTPRVKWMQQTKEIADGYATRIPMKRAARADEIASTIAFLASDDSSYITGIALPVDGGMGASIQPHFMELLPDRA